MGLPTRGGKGVGLGIDTAVPNGDEGCCGKDSCAEVAFAAFVGTAVEEEMEPLSVAPSVGSA